MEPDLKIEEAEIVKEEAPARNFGAENAEKAYKLLDTIKVNEKSLYDIVFDDKSLTGVDKLSPEKKAQFFDFIAKNNNREDKEKLGVEIMKKFPEIIATETGNEFLIKKALRLNSNETFKLAEFYTGTKSKDLMEAVEFAKLYISFLADM